MWLSYFATHQDTFNVADNRLRGCDDVSAIYAVFIPTDTFTWSIQVSYSVYRPPQLIKFPIKGITLNIAENRVQPLYTLFRGGFTVLTVIPIFSAPRFCFTPSAVRYYLSTAFTKHVTFKEDVCAVI
jgi:hypothetical protein